MAIIIGSARIGENGKITGGKDGDQTKGEVSTQNFYVHSKGWYILRVKDPNVAQKLAQAMQIACDNDNIGYNQNERTDVIKQGIETKTPCNSDCSALVRACIIWATGTDVGNFRTVDEVSFLEKSGLFENHKAYTKQADLCNGDILVTKTSGHTVIVISGAKDRELFPSFKVGNTYKTLVNNLNIRNGAGLNNERKTFNQLTPNAKKYANTKGQLNKNTKVTVKAQKVVNNSEVWVKIPSGWICAYTNGKKYVG